MAKNSKYTPEFKAKVVRELFEGDDSINEVATKFKISPKQVYRWRRELLDNAKVVFSQKKAIRDARKVAQEHQEEVDNLNRIIGQTTVERDYLRQCIDKVSKW